MIENSLTSDNSVDEPDFNTLINPADGESYDE